MPYGNSALSTPPHLVYVYKTPYCKRTRLSVCFIRALFKCLPCILVCQSLIISHKIQLDPWRRDDRTLPTWNLGKVWGVPRGISWSFLALSSHFMIARQMEAYVIWYQDRERAGHSGPQPTSYVQNLHNNTHLPQSLSQTTLIPQSTVKPRYYPSLTVYLPTYLPMT